VNFAICRLLQTDKYLETVYFIFHMIKYALTCKGSLQGRKETLSVF